MKPKLKIIPVKKKYPCSHCDREFIAKYQLKWHYLMKDIDLPFKCGSCSKEFVLEDDLVAHTKTHYKKTWAKHWWKKFILMNDENDHEANRKHKYVCEQCDKRFSQKLHLESHLKMHTRDKPYKCNICAFKSVYLSYLKLHMIRRHRNKSEFSEKKNLAKLVKIEAIKTDAKNVRQKSVEDVKEQSSCLIRNDTIVAIENKKHICIC